MTTDLVIRPPLPADLAAWLPLWLGYNAFYGREGPTALDPRITEVTWRRFFEPAEPVHALVAERTGALVGLVHFLYHRSTTRIEHTCYLQDLFTSPDARGQGVGRALIEAVCATAREAGIHRVYWQTHETNAAGRRLYDTLATHQGFIVHARDV